MASEGIEQVELTEPWNAVERAGGIPRLVSLERGVVQAFNHLDKGDEFRGRTRDLVPTSSVGEYDGLVLPGGVANPDALRMDERAVSFIGSFVTREKPVAVICHGPWTLVEADVVRGRILTSWPSLRTDLSNAGAVWVDREVVVDGRLVSSRKPDDLPAFCAKILEVFAWMPLL